MCWSWGLNLELPVSKAHTLPAVGIDSTPGQVVSQMCYVENNSETALELNGNECRHRRGDGICPSHSAHPLIDLDII